MKAALSRFIVIVGAALALVAGACTPTITPGSYLCGPEQLCPEGQACNGPDNTCIEAAKAQPFACGMGFGDPVGDDTPAMGAVVADLSCVSSTFVAKGCLRGEDPADYFQFDVPIGCTAVGISATVAFPIAFQPVAIQLAKGSDPPQRMETTCDSSAMLVEAEEVRCLEMTLEPGAHYAIGLVHDTEANADCDGACTSNRYQLRFQLETP